MALTTFLRFGSRRPKVSTDAFDILGDLVPWQESVDANAAKLSGLGWRNWLRNPSMTVQQRGGGPFTAAGAITADGWIKAHTGGTHTVNVPKLPPSSTGRDSYLESTVVGQSASGDFAQIAQRIESVRSLAGRQVTLSFMASVVAPTTIGVEVRQSFGTGGAPSGDTLTAAGFVPITVAEAAYSLTFTVPLITGKTLGTTPGSDYLELIIWQSAGTSYAGRASNIGIQNSSLNLWDFQLEAGADASPTEARAVAVELALCQRYFVRMGSLTAVTRSLGSGLVYSSTGAIIVMDLPVTMRTAPAMNLITALSSLGVYNATAGIVPVTGLALWGTPSEGTVAVQVTVAGGLVAGQATILITNAAVASLDFSAAL